MKEKIVGLLGKKTLRKKVLEENEESENQEESLEEKRKNKEWRKKINFRLMRDDEILIYFIDYYF